jgi:hypothetical protein
MASDYLVGGNDAFAEDVRRGSAPMRIHVFHKASELCELLQNLGCEHEGATPPSDLQHISLNEVLNCSSNRDAADPESRQQLIFTRQPISWSKISSRDFGSQDLFNLSV